MSGCGEKGCGLKESGCGANGLKRCGLCCGENGGRDGGFGLMHWSD